MSSEFSLCPLFLGPGQPGLNATQLTLSGWSAILDDKATHFVKKLTYNLSVRRAL